MHTQKLNRDGDAIEFDVQLGRVLNSEQAFESGTTRPVLLSLRLRRPGLDGDVVVSVGDQDEIDLRADEDDLRKLIEQWRETLIKRALDQVVPLRSAQADEKSVEEKIDRILAETNLSMEFRATNRRDQSNQACADAGQPGYPVPTACASQPRNDRPAKGGGVIV